MSLDKETRLLLINQYKILQHIEVEPEEDYGKYIEILKNGYEGAYHEFLHWIDDPMSPERCSETHAILNMFWIMGNAIGKLDDTSNLPYNALFRGFSGNDETEYWTFAKFVVSNGQYESLTEHETDNFNSHAPMLPTYRKMLPVFDRIQRRLHDTAYRLMTKDELLEICAAG